LYFDKVKNNNLICIRR